MHVKTFAELRWMDVLRVSNSSRAQIATHEQQLAPGGAEPIVAELGLDELDLGKRACPRMSTPCQRSLACQHMSNTCWQRDKHRKTFSATDTASNQKSLRPLL